MQRIRMKSKKEDLNSDKKLKKKEPKRKERRNVADIYTTPFTHFTFKFKFLNKNSLLFS